MTQEQAHHRYTFDDTALKKNNEPAMLAHEIVRDIPTLQEFNNSNLVLILTELLSNSIDHGLLKLSSLLKSGSIGFEEFYSERDRKINSGIDGKIFIDLKVTPINSNQNEVTIVISDDGHGFDLSRIEAQRPEGLEDFFGRGIKLIKTLAKTCEYSQGGTRATIIMDIFKES